MEKEPDMPKCDGSNGPVGVNCLKPKKGKKSLAQVRHHHKHHHKGEEDGPEAK